MNAIAQVSERFTETSAPGERRPFLAFCADEETAALVRRTVEVRGLDPAAVIVGALDDAVDGLAGIRTPDLLVVDLGTSSDLMIEAERLAQVCDTEARVVLLGQVNDMLIYRELLSAGVADYVVKPFDEDVLSRALERANPTAPMPERQDTEPSSVDAEAVAVIGVRGGVGASTVAANAAWVAAQELERSVTLIDMDLTFGTQALIMDIDPGGGLTEAMREPGRMDDLFVKRATTSIGDRLRVMAAEADTALGDVVSADAFLGLLTFVQQSADLVVVDLPRGLAVAAPSVLAPFARFVLIAEPSLAAMRDSARMAALIAQHRPDADISVVVNRCGIAPKEELSNAGFEDGSGLKVAMSLPFDARTALAAEAAGKRIVQSAPRCKLGRGLNDVARIVAGGVEMPKRRGLLDMLRRRHQDEAGGAD